MFDFDVASGAERYKIARFLDVYGGLLTEAQKEALSLYFNEDLSLGEISDIKGISRQGVRSCIMQGIRVLVRADEKLGFIEIIDKYEKEIETLKRGNNGI